MEDNYETYDCHTDEEGNMTIVFIGLEADAHYSITFKMVRMMDEGPDMHIEFTPDKEKLN